MNMVILAHQGGWDEIAWGSGVALAFILTGVMVYFARLAGQEHPEDEAEAGADEQQPT